MIKHVIWTNDNLDYERDWKDFIESEHPDLSEDERVQLMYELNNMYLDDERINLHIDMHRELIAIGDLGLWYGRRMGYRVIAGTCISDFLSGTCGDYVTWYIDELGDFCCKDCHHDGTNYYTYRVFKPVVTQSQKQALKVKLYEGTATRRDVTRDTERLGDAIANVYGFQIRKKAVRRNAA